MLASKKLKPLYVVIGVFNPINHFPSLSIPIFTELRHPKSKLIQVVGHDRRIEKFESVDDLTAQRTHLVSDSKKVRAVGDQGILAYSISSCHHQLCESHDEFLAALRDNLDVSLYDSWPIAGLEVVRFLGEKEAEVRFSELAVIKIARSSIKIARNWVQHGVMSDVARLAAEQALQKYTRATANMQDDIGLQTGNQIWVTKAFDDDYGKLSQIPPKQNKVMDLQLIAKALVDEAPKLFLLHVDDLNTVTFDQALLDGIRKLKAAGTNILLVEETSLPLDIMNSAQGLITSKVLAKDLSTLLKSKFL